MTSRLSPAAWAEKHLANLPLRALLRLGLAPRAFALLEPLGGAPAGGGSPRWATAWMGISEPAIPRSTRRHNLTMVRQRVIGDL